MSLGTYSVKGSIQCILCQSVVSGVSPTIPVPYYFWTSPLGSSRSSQCVCMPGFTGTNCEYSVCSSTLPGASKGSMLFKADTKLRQFSANASAYALLDIQTYLYELLHVGVDVNGDGNITSVEMTVALSNRLVYSSGMMSLPIWCRTAEKESYCYEDFDGVVEVSSIYADAIANFNISGTFDGSGNFIPLFPEVYQIHCRSEYFVSYKLDLSCYILGLHSMQRIRPFNQLLGHYYHAMADSKESSNQTRVWICKRVFK